MSSAGRWKGFLKTYRLEAYTTVSPLNLVV
jgi:hypothetical protein